MVAFEDLELAYEDLELHKYDLDDLLYKLDRYNQELVEKQKQQPRRSRSRVRFPTLRRAASRSKSNDRAPQRSRSMKGGDRSKSPFFHRTRESNESSGGSPNGNKLARSKSTDQAPPRTRSTKIADRSKSPFFRRTKETNESEGSPNGNNIARSKSSFFRRGKKEVEEPVSRLLSRVVVRQETSGKQQDEQEAPPPTGQDETAGNLDSSFTAFLRDLSLLSVPAAKVKNPCKPKNTPNNSSKNNMGRKQTTSSKDDEKRIKRRASMKSMDVLIDIMDQEKEGKEGKKQPAARRCMSPDTNVETVTLSDDEMSEEQSLSTWSSTAEWDAEREMRAYYQNYHRHEFHPKVQRRSKRFHERDLGFFEILGRNIDDLQRNLCSDPRKARQEEPPGVRVYCPTS